MAIQGLGNMTEAELHEEVQKGGRFVVFSYCISILIMTFRRSSEVHFIRAGEGTFGKSLPYTALSLALGWWGIPWGFIYTPMALFQNLSGGKDVTREVLSSLQR